MRVGDKVTVRRGAFAGISAEVARIADDQIDLLGVIQGELSSFYVDPAELLPEVPEEEIATAVRRRNAHGYVLRQYWTREAQRVPTRAPAALLAGYPLHTAPVAAACEREIAGELARWQSACEGLDEEARAAKWEAERDTWTAWKEQGEAVMARLTAEVLDSGSREDYDKLCSAGTALRERAELEVARDKLALPLAAELRDEALERAIEDDLDRDDAYLVYADWLQGRGDPRGEWIALEVAGSPDANRLREAMVTRLLGPLAGIEHRLEPVWTRGFLEAIKVHTTRDDEELGLDVTQLLRTALALPATRFLRELEIGLPSVHEEISVSATLAAAGPRPALRGLKLTTDLEEEMLSWTGAGDLGVLPDLYPNLEHLEVLAGTFDLPGARFPKLRTLVLQTCYGSAELVRTILAEDWPVLEALELWFGSSQYKVHVTFDDIAPILRAPWPRLQALGLCNCEVTDELCEAVLASPLLPQLKRLSLAKGTMTAVGADALVRDADLLRHLEWIDVDENYLDNAALDRLRDAGLTIESTWQRSAEDEGGRYASVGE